MIITQYETIRNTISTKIDKKIRPRLSLYHFFYFGSVKLPSVEDIKRRTKVTSSGIELLKEAGAMRELSDTNQVDFFSMF